MKTKRIIPCLDVQKGRVVKGVNFVDIKDVGDPVECAVAYEKQGADELVLLDIDATYEERDTMTDVVRRTAAAITVPLAIGGGIRTIEDIRRLLEAGADKISINSAAIKRPELVKEAAETFGSACIVIAIDGKKDEFGVFRVVINGGRETMELAVDEWAKTVESYGAGEILLTSMDADGTKMGFDLEMLNAVCSAVDIPVIASGGCGKLADFTEVFEKTSADAALAASVFHYGELTVGTVKEELRNRGIAVG